jgi:hypothetical protein
MYLVDANILVYSTDEDSEHHAAARDWLDERTAGAPRSVGLPWPSLLAFFRLVTNPRIYSPPAAAADAWQRIEEWLPGRRPGSRYRDRGMSRYSAGSSGNAALPGISCRMRIWRRSPSSTASPSSPRTRISPSSPASHGSIPSQPRPYDDEASRCAGGTRRQRLPL